MTNTPFRPMLRTQSDVQTMWRAIINPLGWHSRRLYAVVVDDDDRPRPLIHEIDGLPARMTHAEATEALCILLADGRGRRLAVLFCRPGAGAALTAGDRAVCGLLYAAARRLGIALDVIHVATDTAIVPAPLDEMQAAVS